MFERHQRQLRHDKRTVPAVKLCTVCGVVTSRAGSRCTEHARQSNRSRHNALYSTPAWQRLSARVLRVWRGERGNWCPGYGRPAHPASDLFRLRSTWSRPLWRVDLRVLVFTLSLIDAMAFLDGVV